jgi:hypothetical protein
MTTEMLRQKTSRYLYGTPMPAEEKQIQHWLSCTNDIKKESDFEVRERVEQEILEEVKAYTAYPLFYPKKESWWKKFV